ncbi:caspase family protein [Granulosicoccus sp. 3-233]|uniref:caspase family protein n=1 Tax=Granulosicoccus sp. 3-233 TaxID=3417969 RepID=UPI003D341DB0
MSKLFVLQVGINAYSPQVGALLGCVNDVHNIRDYLSECSGNSVEAVQLLDEDATRANVITAFREHLCQAKENDQVLFHYSGHGARWRSAPEFRQWNPGGWDEGLVLFDSRGGNSFDLADKELAILLSEVGRQQANISVLLDCCHSGTATRSMDDFALNRVRQTHQVNDPRPLESYLDGYYQQLLDKGQPLRRPGSRHILMAACERKQKAWEGHDHQGVFSQALLEVLRGKDQDLAYANVFVRCRELVRNRTSNQEPQFETMGGFRAYDGFLGHTASARGRRLFVQCRKGQWQLDRGAIFGLPTAPDKPTEMELYAPNSQQKLGHAHTTQVAAQHSMVDIEGFIPDDQVQYEAELTSMPVLRMPVGLIVEGGEHEAATIDGLLTDNEDLLREFELLRDTSESVRYVLRIDAGTWRLERQANGSLILGASGDQQKSAEHVLNGLNHIADWERLLQLQNDSTEMDPAVVDFRLTECPEGGVEATVDGDEFVFNVHGSGNGGSYFRGKLTASNQSDQELHFALLGMEEDYAVYIPFNEAIEPTDASFEFVYPMQKEDSSGELEDSPYIYPVLPEEKREQTFFYKLLVSTERIDHPILERSPLDGLGSIKEFSDTGSKSARGGSFGPPPRRKKVFANEWFTRTITVRLVRAVDEVRRNQPLQLADGQITITSHSDFRANVALEAAEPATRGVGSSDTGFTHALEQTGSTLLNFSRTRGEDCSVLELSAIENDADLRENPLLIELNTQLARNEFILPMVFDGENMIIAGQPQKDEQGNVLVELDHIPETPNRKRSLGKALKLYFFKCVLGKESVNKLSWVEFLADGKVTRHEKGVREHLDGKTKVLVLIHGIIGDTKNMAEALPHISVGDSTLKDTFDAVLTYDYENLNTPLESTASTLGALLENAGLHKDDHVNVTLLSHSMGGLISRWFIEQSGGNEVVDHLVMCGTPNSGSPFGHVGSVRSVASMLGSLTMSTFPATAPFLASVLYSLNVTRKLTPTLEQMQPGSAFLARLAQSPDPGIPYSIIAGDVYQYDEETDGWVARLVNKVGQGYLFSQLYSDAPHDIAVEVASIQSVVEHATTYKQTVPCHHMNYFVSSYGVAALGKLRW